MTELVSAQRRLLQQSSHYSLASLAAMVSGLISFPILTRVFSVADYGTMNLVAVTLSISVAFGKLGIQQSIVRYHSEITAEKTRFRLPQLYSTALLTMFGSAVLIVTLLLAANAVLLPLLDLPSRIRGLLALGSLLVIGQVIESGLINFLRAEQATVTLLRYQITKKYAVLAAILGALFLVASTLTVFYTATLIAEALALGILASVMFRRVQSPWPRFRDFSRQLGGELLRFGLPMMIGYEMSGIALSVGDRYVIAGMLGDEPLGLYSASYNLCQYVQATVISSVGQAIMPLYLQVYDRKGATEASHFITQSLRVYAIVGVAVTAGLASVGPVLLPALASEKYAGAGLVIPWVIAGMLVDGASSMLGAGLFIQRRTRTIMAMVLSCAVLNIGLNVVLVPHWSIVGSAVATLVSYLATAAAMGIAGRKSLRVDVPWGTLARAAAVAGVMCGVLSYVDLHDRWLTVGARVAAGAVIYGGLMVLVDGASRSLGRDLYATLRMRVGGRA